MYKGLRGCLIDSVYASYSARVSFFGNMFREKQKKAAYRPPFLLTKQTQNLFSIHSNVYGKMQAVFRFGGYE